MYNSRKVVLNHIFYTCKHSKVKRERNDTNRITKPRYENIHICGIIERLTDQINYILDALHKIRYQRFPPFCILKTNE